MVLRFRLSADYYASINTVSLSGAFSYTFPSPYAENIYQELWPTTSTTTGTVDQATYHTISVKSAGGEDDEPFDVAAWIDYNRDGVFESTENVLLGSDETPGSTVSHYFAVPGSADTGLTGLRVRCGWYESASYAFGIGAACSEIEYTYTADFVINIGPGLPCVGMPTAGVAYGGGGSVCAEGLGGTFTLTDTAATLATGITYQWISRPSGTTAWDTVPSGTSTTLTAGIDTATDFAFVTTCNVSHESDTTLSAIQTESINPFYLCYCQPALGTTLGSTGESGISSLDWVAISTSTLNYSFTSPSSENEYQQFWPTTPSTTDSMKQALSYTISVLSLGGTFHEYDYYAEAWIDYDHNGVFDPTTDALGINENILSTPEYVGYADTVTNTFDIPTNCDTGLTGLRVRVSYDGDPMSALSACSNEYYSFTADFVVRIAPGVPCTGTPSPGTIFASTASVCGSNAQSFNLTDTGSTAATGIIAYWSTRTAGTTAWDTLTSGAGLLSTHPTGITQDTASDYMLTTVCTNSGDSATATVTVGNSPFYLCYCSPLVGTTLTASTYSYESASLDTVRLSGTTLNYASSGEPVFATPLYTEYWPTTATTTGTITQATTTTLEVASNGGLFGDQYGAAAWIDYNHNGTFESGENVLLETNQYAGTVCTATIFVPGSALTGLTGLRVRVCESDGGYSTSPFYLMSASSACTEQEEAYTADFVIDIAAGTACTGMPTAGTPFANADSVCESTALVLTDTGFTEASMVSFQWVSSPHGAGTFTAIPGATTNVYDISQSAASDYKFIATCTVSGDSATSSVITVGQTPFYECYCTSGLADDYPYYSYFDTVKVIDGSLDYGNTVIGSGYIFVPSSVASDTFTAGSSYTINVTAGTEDTYESYNGGMWIDADHSGSFDASEYTAFASGSTTYSPSSVSATFAVPASSDTGFTRMRLRMFSFGDALSSTDACLEEDGQTIDFVVYINPAPVCAGVPDAGTASSVGSACDSTHITLSDPGAYTVGGLRFQWISSSDGGTTWSNIAGATTDPYTFSGLDTTTQFKLRVYCTASGDSNTSNTITVIKTPCYCTDPQYYDVVYDGESATAYEGMKTFKIAAGFGGTSLVDSVIYSDVSYGGYADHTGTSGLNTLQMIQGSTYTAVAGYNGSLYDMENQIWIDFNNDGSFANVGTDTEVVTPVFGSYSSGVLYGTGTITIPANATPGYHRMRVRDAEASSSSSAMSPCAIGDATAEYYWAGDVVDYNVFIVSNYCASITSVIATPATPTSETLSWISDTVSIGYVYAVTTTDAPPASDTGSAVATTTSNSALVTGLTAVLLTTAGYLIVVVLVFTLPGRLYRLLLIAMQLPLLPLPLLRIVQVHCHGLLFPVLLVMVML